MELHRSKKRTRTPTMKPGQAERIGHLFLRGYSLDLISELGMTNGSGPTPAWTRDEARQVVTDRGWSLDTFGRLHPESLAREKFGALPVSGPSVAEIETDHLLNVGIDHENEIIRNKARKCIRALEDLRGTLVMQEKADATRAAVSRLAAESPDFRHTHGSVEGYQAHQTNGTVVCMSCQAAWDRVTAAYDQLQGRPGISA